MSESSETAVNGREMTASPAVAPPIASAPRARWSDLWKAPLHDFPIRDEILYQHLSLPAGSAVLEIGPGSGFTAFRLARWVHRITLLDVAEETIDELRRHLHLLTNLTCVRDDITRPGLLDRIGGGFDAAFGLDVFEYVVDPAACLQNLAAVLRPGGELLLTYPNVPPPVGDGVTYFAGAEDLARLLAQAGFREWRISAARIRPWARVIYRLLHEWPLGAYRRLRGGSRDDRPQTYESTWAFKHRQRLMRYKVPLHLIWLVLGWVMRLGGPVFTDEPVTGAILGQQLVIRAWR